MRGFPALEPSNCRPNTQQADYEAFAVQAAIAVRALRGLFASRRTTAATGRPRDNLALSAHALAAGRLQLPASADLLGLRRRSDRAFWIVGRRMDDAGPAIALSAVRHLRDRQRAGDKTRWRALVSSVAVRTLARRQCGVTTTLRCIIRNGAVTREPEPSSRVGSMSSLWGTSSMRPQPSGHDPRQIDLLACGGPLSDRTFQSPPHQQLR
jgi:hypothetical protein